MTKRFNLRNLYLYLVCLITLIIFIVSLIQTVDSLIDVVIVDTGYMQTYELYKDRYIDREAGEDIEYVKTEEEMKKEYEEYLETEKDRQRRINTKRLISSVFAAFISGGFWSYHWRKVQKEKDE